MERILEQAKARGVEAEITVVSRERLPVRFANNDMESLALERTVDVILRVIHGGRIGLAAASALEDGGDLLGRALATCPTGPEAAFEFPEDSPSGSLGLFDSDLPDLPVQIMIEEGKRQMAAVRAMLGEDVALKAELVRKVERIRIANTAGLACEQQRTSFDQDLIAAFPGSGAGPWAEQKTVGFEPMDYGKIAYLARGFDWARRNSTPATGRRQLLVAPSAMDAFLWRLETAASGRSLIDGVSVLENKVGERLLDPRVTLWDKPHLRGHPGGRSFDDEGVATQDRRVFDRGVFAGFLYSLETAAQVHGAASTGNGYKQARFAAGAAVHPRPQALRWTLDGGETDHEALIAAMRDGVILYTPLGAHSGNIVAGQFSVTVGVGYHVVNGEVVGRAMNTMVSGNVYDLFNRLAAISHDTNDDGLPWVLFDGVDIAGR
ncbi:MAG: TldD/PmbA family protein [Myxococcales bacterium]|nr:MAG: TldD/PmbA family protein [Myxococcales bacterium]